MLLARLDFLPWPRRRHASCPYPEVVVDMTRLKFLSATLLATPGALMSAGCTHEDSVMPAAADGRYRGALLRSQFPNLDPRVFADKVKAMLTDIYQQETSQ